MPTVIDNISFDGNTKIISLTITSVAAAEIWSRWCDWYSLNSNWLPALMEVGGDTLGGGLYIPPYFFLLNGWRVRPMEASHTLIITGNLFVLGGGVPVIPTIGNYNVSVQYTVPVQAQGISVSGSSGPTVEQIRDGVLGASPNSYPVGSIGYLIKKIYNLCKNILSLSA